MNDEKLMTIREMCEAFDVTARTLRFYEAKELLFPIREGQRRLFTKRDRARLTLILRGKRFGFSLENIRQLLDLYNDGDGGMAQLRSVHAAAKARLEQLAAERRALDELIDDLQARITWGEQVISKHRGSSAA